LTPEGIQKNLEYRLKYDPRLRLPREIKAAKEEGLDISPLIGKL
jgi:hypothetical protein